MIKFYNKDRSAHIWEDTRNITYCNDRCIFGGHGRFSFKDWCNRYDESEEVVFTRTKNCLREFIYTENGDKYVFKKRKDHSGDYDYEILEKSDKRGKSMITFKNLIKLLIIQVISWVAIMYMIIKLWKYLNNL